MSQLTKEIANNLFPDGYWSLIEDYPEWDLPKLIAVGNDDNTGMSLMSALVKQQRQVRMVSKKGDGVYLK